MILPWLTGGIAALDLFIKDEIEREGEEEFPRDLPGTKGLIRLHKSYNSGFPFGFLKERPELVKGIPLAVTSAAAGALGAFMTKKGCLAQKIGLSMVLGGAISNLYDRLVKEGFMKRTPRGREVTELAYKHLGRSLYNSQKTLFND